MKTVIQIIEKSTGIIYKEISTIEQLMKFLEAEVMHEDFQRRTAIENLFLKSKKGLSLDFLWEAKFVEKKTNNKK